ncbi:hypothetical protein Afil01_34750 [Actinorhabdospora filicis]|uniref:DUF7927 domain-containing protein n=1 Tax=Actinorhabdospora filicis TaxID=1785913 RepID=A0A9W6WA50_9ACTN|nr:isopeptide-forming domain-containing fimbrial protein [Actinorhabdospora filicis]GLZ78668.1 hypothetical protein Afil01_34750 [Actinorhabdospora filicis]
MSTFTRLAARLTVLALAVPSAVFAIAAPAYAASWTVSSDPSPASIDCDHLYSSFYIGSLRLQNDASGNATPKNTTLAKRGTPGPPDYWATDMAIGPDPDTGAITAFYSSYTTANLTLYKQVTGTTTVTDTIYNGQTRTLPSGTNWGGLTMDAKSGLLYGFQNGGVPKIFQLDLKTGTSKVWTRGTNLTSVPANDPVFAGGTMVPDGFVDRDGGVYYGLSYGGLTYIYRLDPATGTTQQAVKVTGPGSSNGFDNYGMAYLNGYIYLGYYAGSLYRVDPKTGASTLVPGGAVSDTANQVGSVDPNPMGSWKITDLAGCSTSRNLLDKLEVTKTVSPANAKPGDKVSYRIEIANTGTTAATGVSLTDDLSGVIDDATYGADAKSTVDGANTTTQPSYTAPRLTWTGDIAAGKTVVVTYTATVKNPPTGDSSLKNTVTVPGSNCASGSTDPDCATTVPIAWLKVKKTASPAQPLPGQKVTYTVTVTNPGTGAYTGASVTDDLTGVLDDATYNADATASSGSVGYGARKVTWTGTVAAGATVTITYSVTVGNPPGGDKVLRNAVTGGSNCPAGSTDPDCATVTPVTGLIVKKTVTPETARPGDVITYLITVENVGATAANADITDDLTGVIDDATYGNDAVSTIDEVRTTTQPAYTAPKLTWKGSVPGGKKVVIAYTVEVKNPATGDKSMKNKVTGGSNCATGSTDPNCGTTTPVVVYTVKKTASPAVASPGQKVTYTVTVTSTGNGVYKGATFTDDLTGVLEDATWDGLVTQTTGTTTYTSPKLTWTGDIQPGTPVTITYSVTVANPPTGDKRLTNVVTGGSNCPAGSTNADCKTTTPIKAIKVTKTAKPPFPKLNETVTFTVVVENIGTVAYNNATFSDDLTDVLDDAYWSGVSADTGSAVRNGNTLTWTGNLPIGGKATVLYYVTAHFQGNGTIKNTVTSPDSNCPPGSTDPNCNTITPPPGLRITKTASPATARPGDTVTYTLTVQNTSGRVYNNATATDDLTGVLDDATWGSVTASTGTATFTTPKLTWTGNLAVNASATITYTVTVKRPQAGDKQLKNTVTGPADSNCPTGNTDPVCKTTTPVATITVAKTSRPATAKPGDTVTYTVTVTNTGLADYMDASFADDLSGVLDDATFGTVSSDSGSAMRVGNRLTWTGNVAKGATATITYTVTVNNPPGGDKLLKNTVTTPDGCTANCSTETPVATLEITKTAAPASAKPGEKVTYTVTVKNTGTGVYTGATFTDDLTGVIDDATYNADAAASSGTTTYTAPKLKWTGDVTAGATVTVTYSVTVSKPPTGDLTLKNAITECPTCGTETPVAKLEITKTVSPSPARPGDKVTYTVTVKNTGTGPYAGATFTDDLTGVLDDAAYNADAAASSGTTSYTAPKLTWTGDVAAGATVTVTYSVTVGSPPAGDKVLKNAVTAPDGCTGDCGTETPVATYTVAKTASPAEAGPGDTVTYTVTVTNNSRADYTGASFSDDLSGVIDDAAWGSVSASSGTASYTPTTLTWTGDVRKGRTVTVTYTVTVNKPPTGDKVLKNKLTGGTNCPAGSTDPDCATETKLRLLQVKKTVSPAAPKKGETVTYTITVRNTGTADYPGASVSDDLSAVLDDATWVSVTADVGTALRSGNTLTWTGDLAVGESATIVYKVTVTNAGDKILRNAVSGEDSNCPAGSTDPDCSTVTPTPNLTITKTASATTAKPGETITYTLTVRNTGAAAYTGATVRDDLSGVIDDATWGSVTATSGTAAYSAPTLSWSGDVAAGASVTITYTVTVNKPPGGDKQLKNAVTGTADSNCPAGSSDPNCSTTTPVATYTVAKTASPASAKPGETVTYTVTVTNDGQADYTGASFTDDLSGVVDDATWGSVTASSGVATYTPTTLSWNGNLAKGATATITYTVTVNTPPAGDKSLKNAVTGTDGSTCEGDCTTVTPVAALTYAKTASTANAKPGDKVTYTVTVTNSGTGVYKGATVTDDLTGVIDDATYNDDAAATSGTVAYTAPRLTWSGDVAAGATVTITYSVTVNKPPTGDLTLKNAITECPTCGTETLVGRLAIAKTASPASAKPGDTVTYTITVENTGTGPYPGASVSDDLSGVLDDAAWGAVSADTGTATFTSPTLTWTGDLNAGQKATITYTVTVGKPPGGDKKLKNTVTGPDGSQCTGSCSTETPVATYRLKKTATPATAKPGETVTYTVRVINDGEAEYKGASFTDDLSGVLDDATWGSVTASKGTATFASPTLSWTGDLAKGEEATITYTVTVNTPPAGDKKLTNAVTGTDGSTCEGDCTTVTPVAALTIAKTASPASAKPGDTVTYTVTVTNSGTGVYRGGTFTDDLTGVVDDATYNNDASATSGSVSYTAPKLTWTGDVAAGGTVTVTYTVTVSKPPTGDLTLKNAIAECPDCGTVTPIAKLTIKKTASPAEVKPGGKVTYTVTVTNEGEAAYPGASVTDDLTGVLDDAAYNNDATATSGTVTYSAPKLTWTGDVAAKGTVTLTYSVTVNTPPAGDKKLTNAVTGPDGSTCDGDCTTVTPVASYSLRKTASPATAKPGETVTYTVTVTNTGATEYKGASFSDDLSGVLDDATWGSVSASAGTATRTGNTLSWSGDLPVGGTATVTYTVTVNTPPTGDKKLGNAVTGTDGSTCEGDCTTVTPIAVLAVKKTATPASALPGGKVTYTVTVTNTGTGLYRGGTFTDDLSGVIDDATYNTDATASSGTVSYTAPRLTWTGDVAAGATVTVTYSVTVGSPPAGDKNLINAVTGGGNCPAGSSDPDCSTVVPLGNLVIAKTAAPASAKPGETVTYTVTVTNNGRGPVNNASFTDDLTGVLDDAVYNNDASASSGTASYASPKLTWSGIVEAGATVTVTYTVTVNRPPGGDKKLKNAVTGEGTNCATACETETPIATYTITKTARPATVKPGETVTYTVTVTNDGQADYPGATFTDDLTGVIDDATYNNDATASTGTAVYTAPRLTWTGNLAKGATVTVTYTATVNDPPGGDKKLTNAITECPSCGTETPVAILTITKTASPASARPGDKVTYTVTVSNTGTGAYKGATFTDDLTGVIDDATYNKDAAATGGSVSYTAPKLTWTGDVAAGKTVTVTYTVTVNKPPTGDLTLKNAITECPSCGTETPVAKLEIRKTSAPASAKPGETVTYTITVRNTGTGPYPGASVSDDLSGVIDDAAYNADATASSGTVTYTAPKLTWTGDVTAGQTVTITYTVTVGRPPAGDKRLKNAVTGPDGSTCPPGSADPGCSTITPLAALKASKKADKTDASPGEKVTYTLTVENTGRAAYTGASLTDDLSDVLDDATWNDDATADKGTVAFTPPTLTWSGDLAAGEKATITYTVTVTNAGDRRMSNVIVVPDSNCATGSADPDCDVVLPSPNLKIYKSATPGPVSPGDVVRYTVLVVNTGDGAYRDARVSDDLTGVLDDADYNNDATATTGSAAWQPPNLVWTGTVPGKTTVTIRYSVTVKKTGLGDHGLHNQIQRPDDAICPKPMPAGTARLAEAVIDPNCSTDTPVRAFTLTKRAEPGTVKTGQKVTYTVTVTNTGKGGYDSLAFTDDLTRVLERARYNGDATATAGTVTVTGARLTWRGPLPVAATVTVTYSVTATAAGKLVNAVTTTTPGGNCASPGEPGCSATTTVTPPLPVTGPGIAGWLMAAGALIALGFALRRVRRET